MNEGFIMTTDVDVVRWYKIQGMTTEEAIKEVEDRTRTPLAQEQKDRIYEELGG